MDTSDSENSAIHSTSSGSSSSIVSSDDEEPTVLPGRVVRLHFTCKAELPIGSSLRVTGSTLWAPSAASAQDPTNAHHIAQEQTAQSFPTAEEDFTSGGQATTSLYTSSVELVTTPDEYPVWRTRRPVVVVLQHRHKKLQHHYYRYLVVTPGAKTTPDVEDDEEQDEEQQVRGVADTSCDMDDVTPVMSWEDPFRSRLDDQKEGEQSMASMTSSVFRTTRGVEHQKVNLWNLPYRTVDIDVASAKPTVEPLNDIFNNPDDPSFRSYLIRDAMNEQNRRKYQSRMSDISDEASATPMDSGTATPMFHEDQRIYFICFHLPVVVVKNKNTGEWRASWSESILAKTDDIGNKLTRHWVGTVTTTPPIQSLQDKKAVRKILEEMNCTPIFLDHKTRQEHYYGFCKQVLWPAFHNIDLLDLATSGWAEPVNDEEKDENTSSNWDQSRLDGWWQAYQDVNRQFSQVVCNMLRQGDILWVHDYHLSLLPRFVQEYEIQHYSRAVTKKIFFLHIPFPTSQNFRELECGELILRGTLHADVVGFHAFDHARHFLNATKRILGLNYESLVGGLIGVNFNGKTVLVTMSNVSIEPKLVDAALLLPSVQAGQDELKKKHGDRLVIGCLDIGQRMSGISLRLLAFERLLQDYKTWQHRVVLVQRVLLPGSRKADEQLTVNEIRIVVRRIQDRFGPNVIDYEELSGSSMPMDQRLALWKASDVLMSTPIREGLNHLPMEYIYARKETPGVVITSEFSAVSSILNGALRVNPYDIKMTITMIDKALSMDLQEREGRRYRDIDFVSSSPSDKWVRNVLRDLRDATVNQPVTSENNSAVSSPNHTPTPVGKALIDSTAAFLARERNLGFLKLNRRAVKKAYDISSHRAIILDFNGTIVMKEPPGKYLKREILGTSGNKPPPEVIDALATLCSDPHNTVYVVSGDSADNVLSALGHIPGLGLAVSNGARFSPPAAAGEVRRWKTFDLGVDWAAVKRVALPVLSKYTARSNGSFVKLTAFSIGWSYYSCDPEWGSLQASHLVLELENELRAFDVRFVTLKGIVEIVPRRLNKGLIVKKVLRDTSLEHPDGVDFILCFGDDVSDEKMFTSVFSFVAEAGEDIRHLPGPAVVNEDGSVEEPMDTSSDGVVRVRDPLFSYTVAVGKKPSHASSYVNDTQEVANTLVLLAQGHDPSSSFLGESMGAHMFS